MLFKNYILKINKNKYYFNHIIIKVIFINYFFGLFVFLLVYLYNSLSYLSCLIISKMNI